LSGFFISPPIQGKLFNKRRHPKKKNQKYIYYHCSGDKGKVHSAYIRQDELALKLGDGLKYLEIPVDILEWIKSKLRTNHEKEREFHNGVVQRLQAQYNRLQKWIDQAYQDKLDGVIDVES
jgi:hypothetical protein